MQCWGILIVVDQAEVEYAHQRFRRRGRRDRTLAQEANYDLRGQRLMKLEIFCTDASETSR